MEILNCLITVKKYIRRVYIHVSEEFAGCVKFSRVSKLSNFSHL
jgi:hypothetical protein